MRTTADPSKGRFQELISKLTALLKGQEVTPEAVHRVRTTARRIESVLRFHDSADDSSVTKTLKRLARLRKAAGKVRDVDVMLRLLSTVDCDNIRDRRRLESFLIGKRSRRAEKLAVRIAKEVANDVAERLRKLPTPGDRSADSADHYVDGAIAQLTQESAGFEHLNEQNLHQFRTVCKRARYVAELAGDNEIAEGLRGELKAMQDAIGEWHDWTQLAQASRRALSNPTAPLALVIRAIRRTKYNNALTVAARGQEQVALLRSSRALTSARKPPMKAASAHRLSRLDVVK